MPDGTTGDPAARHLHPVLLEVDELHVAYGKAEVLHGVTFRVHAGEFVSILGRNGAGKSTTVHALSGLIGKRSGRVGFAGVDVTHRSAAEIVRAGMIQVLQGHRIFPSLSIESNILIGSYSAGAQAGRARLEEIYQTFPELAAKRRLPAAGLSGGQQQILAVAQGVIASPKLLILDEPSLGLGPLVIERILEIATKLRQAGVAILLIEQLVDKALSRSDHCYLMETGRMVFDAPAAELVGSEALHQAFLGGHMEAR